jgi:hypothetical protein
MDGQVDKPDERAEVRARIVVEHDDIAVRPADDDYFLPSIHVVAPYTAPNKLRCA